MQTLTPQITITIRSAYSPKRSIQLICPTKGRTKQSFKAECDINTIVNRFLKTGVMDFAQKNEPRYGDTTGIEFQSAMNTVAAANSLFNELPAALRARFENEPAQFLDFVQDDKNAAEARELGLLKPPVEAPTPQKLPTSHREDGSATHEPLRAADGTYREHTRAEKRAEAKSERDARGKAEGDAL